MRSSWGHFSPLNRLTKRLDPQAKSFLVETQCIFFLLPTICGTFIVETRPEQYGDEPRSLEIKSYATTFTSFQSRTIYSAILELKTGHKVYYY
mmetsp:Transcript_43831/g.64206  ORF Transcript_43831/g.64206 Transcript_43831/m.64206 type:complete len:93 (-) Transcript_43831:832-1110(-)